MPQLKKPLIAVPADCQFFDNYKWHAAPEQYLNAVNNIAHLCPIILPSLGTNENLDAILDVVDGVLITGAKSNIEPHHYGKEKFLKGEIFDPARDENSFNLIRAAIERGLPLLAICRGIQEMNVALGGTLSQALQDLDNHDDHRASETDNQDEKFKICQSITIVADSFLSSIIKENAILVNSVHQQGIELLAPQLVINATANDGTIEAVSVKNAKNFTLGVQWHPEYWAENDKPSNQIFNAFGKAVRAHQQQSLLRK